MEQKFEHSALEQDIKRLFAEIKERGLAQKGREAVKTVIKEQMAAPAPSQPVPPASSGAPVAPISPLPDYLQPESPEMKLKVEKLLDLAWHKGLKRAADEARGGSPLVLDAFHDALTDKLYSELKQRGLLK